MSRKEPIALQILRSLDAVGEWSGRAVAWLTLPMVLVTCTIVLLRYVFHLGWIGLQESVSYLHACVFLIGAAYTLRHEGHVRVDIFYQRFSERGRAWVDLCGALLLLGPVCVFIAWESWDYVVAAWRVREGSPDAGGLPLVYLLKSLIPALAVLLLLQGAASVLRNLLYLAGFPVDRTAEPARQEA